MASPTQMKTAAEVKAEATKAQRALDLAIQRADKAAAALAQLEVAQEPGEHSVIRFVRTLPVNYGNITKDYAYAAIRAGGLWYLTGQQTRGLTWKQLIEFVRSGKNAMAVEVLSHDGTLDLS